MGSSPVTVNSDNTPEETFELALQDLPPPPPPKNTLVSSDSVTSNEEFLSDSGGAGPVTPVGVKPTIASKMLDGTFTVDKERKASLSSLDSKSDVSTVVAENCKVQSDSKQIKIDDDKVEDNATTHSKRNKTKLTETNDSQYKTDLTVLKTDGDNDKILANDKQMKSNALLKTASHNNSTFHGRETLEMEDFPYPEEASPGDDDGEFQEVMSSRKSRRARKIKGVSMEDRSYTYKPIDKDGVRRGGNNAGLRKSSSEPASMARLGELDPEQPFDYGRRLPNNRNNVTATFGISRDVTNNDKPALVPPPKPNSESTPPPAPPSTISYAGKVKAGISHQPAPPAQNTPKSTNPVKFTLEDEHSDGHVSDSSIKSPQNDGPPSAASHSQRTVATKLLSSTVQTLAQTKGEDSIADGNHKVMEEKPEMSLVKHPLPAGGGTSPKFEISFGEFTSVLISGAPQSLKNSCDLVTSEGLSLSSGSRPLQKTRSNSVDGFETVEGAATIMEKANSTTLQHQEANVQYLDLHQQSANTYASRVKRSLTSNSPSQGLAPVNKAGEDLVRTHVRLNNTNVALESSLVPAEPPMNIGAEQPVGNKLQLAATAATNDHHMQLGIENKGNHMSTHQGSPSSLNGSNAISKPQNSSIPRVENKTQQVMKAHHLVDVNHPTKISSPTPSISSSKGGVSSVCFPLSMEPINLGITFGDGISEVLNQIPNMSVSARHGSPVDKLMTGGAAEESHLPQVPRTGHSCTDLEMAWRGENTVTTIGGGDGTTEQQEFLRGMKMMNTGGIATASAASHMESANIGNFNYLEVAGMLMKGR